MVLQMDVMSKLGGHSDKSDGSGVKKYLKSIQKRRVTLSGHFSWHEGFLQPSLKVQQKG